MRPGNWPCLKAANPVIQDYLSQGLAVRVGYPFTIHTDGERMVDQMADNVRELRPKAG